MGLIIDGNQPNLGPSTPIKLVNNITKDFKASVNINFHCKRKQLLWLKSLITSKNFGISFKNL
jgi:hypothetical protein